MFYRTTKGQLKDTDMVSKYWSFRYVLLKHMY